MFQHEKQQILEQLDNVGIGFGPGITEPTHPTDGIPYSAGPFTPEPPFNIADYILPSGSDEFARRPDWQRIVADSIVAEVNSTKRIVN